MSSSSSSSSSLPLLTYELPRTYRRVDPDSGLAAIQSSYGRRRLPRGVRQSRDVRDMARDYDNVQRAQLLESQRQRDEYQQRPYDEPESPPLSPRTLQSGEEALSALESLPPPPAPYSEVMPDLRGSLPRYDPRRGDLAEYAHYVKRPWFRRFEGRQPNIYKPEQNPEPRAVALQDRVRVGSSSRSDSDLWDLYYADAEGRVTRPEWRHRRRVAVERDASEAKSDNERKGLSIMATDPSLWNYEDERRLAREHAQTSVLPPFNDSTGSGLDWRHPWRYLDPRRLSSWLYPQPPSSRANPIQPTLDSQGNITWIDTRDYT